MLASTTEQYAKLLAKQRNNGFEAAAVLVNIGLFFLIADRDLQSVKIDALTHPDPWRRSLCSRIILLTIHELDMDKVAGKDLRDALNRAGISEDGRRPITQALRMVRSAQKNARNKFTFLRNTVIAHRDADALLQYRAITDIDEREVMEIVGEFYDGTQLFLRVFPDLLIQVGFMRGLLNEIMSRTNSR